MTSTPLILENFLEYLKSKNLTEEDVDKISKIIRKNDKEIETKVNDVEVNDVEVNDINKSIEEIEQEKKRRKIKATCEYITRRYREEPEFRNRVKKTVRENRLKHLKNDYIAKYGSLDGFNRKHEIKEETNELKKQLKEEYRIYTEKRDAINNKLRELSLERQEILKVSKIPTTVVLTEIPISRVKKSSPPST